MFFTQLHTAAQLDPLLTFRYDDGMLEDHVAEFLMDAEKGGKMRERGQKIVRKSVGQKLQARIREQLTPPLVCSLVNLFPSGDTTLHDRRRKSENKVSQSRRESFDWPK